MLVHMNYHCKRFYVSGCRNATLVDVPTGTRQLPTSPAEHRVLAAFRDAVDRSGRSQGSIAADVGVSQSQLSKLLRGERAFSFTEMTALADSLGVKLSDLVRDAGL